MNKLIKMLLSTSLVVALSVPSLASATTIEPKYSTSTQELIEMFPSYKDSIEENTTGVLAGSQEAYVKFIAKENANVKKAYNLDTLNEDFYVEYFSREEYKKEMEKDLLSINRGIGEQEGGITNWLRIDLEVYYGSGSSDYIAYNFASWITKPIFRFEDGIGISSSNGLIMSKDPSTRRAEYRTNDISTPIGSIKKLEVDISTNGNGVLATGNLANYPSSNEYHNWMIQTGISYDNPNTKNGWITGHYIHKQIALGDMSMDSEGVPGVSIGGSTDSVSGAVHVSR